MENHKSITQTMRQYQSQQSRSQIPIYHKETIHSSSDDQAGPLTKYLRNQSKPNLTIFDQLPSQNLRFGQSRFTNSSLGQTSVNEVFPGQFIGAQSMLLPQEQAFTSASDLQNGVSLETREEQPALFNARYEQTGHFVGARTNTSDQSLGDKYQSVHDSQALAFNHGESCQSHFGLRQSSQLEYAIKALSSADYSPVDQPRSSLAPSSSVQFDVRQEQIVPKTKKKQQNARQTVKKALEKTGCDSKINCSLMALTKSIDDIPVRQKKAAYHTVRQASNEMKEKALNSSTSLRRKVLNNTRLMTKSQPQLKRKAVKQEAYIGFQGLRFPTLNCRISPFRKLKEQNSVEYEVDLLPSQKGQKLNQSEFRHKYSSTSLTPLNKSITFSTTQQLPQRGRASKKSSASKHRSRQYSAYKDRSTSIQRSRSASQQSVKSVKSGRSHISKKSNKSIKSKRSVKGKKCVQCKNCQALSRRSESRSQKSGSKSAKGGKRKSRSKEKTKSAKGSRKENSNYSNERKRSAEFIRSVPRSNEYSNIQSAALTPTDARMSQSMLQQPRLIHQQTNDVNQTTACFAGRTRRNSNQFYELPHEGYQNPAASSLLIFHDQGRRNSYEIKSAPAIALQHQASQQVSNPEMRILSHNPSSDALEAAIVNARQYFPTMTRSVSTKSAKSPSLPERAIYSYRRSQDSNSVQGQTFREYRPDRSVGQDISIDQTNHDLKASKSGRSLQLNKSQAEMTTNRTASYGDFNFVSHPNSFPDLINASRSSQYLPQATNVADMGAQTRQRIHERPNSRSFTNISQTQNGQAVTFQSKLWPSHQTPTNIPTQKSHLKKSEGSASPIRLMASFASNQNQTLTSKQSFDKRRYSAEHRSTSIPRSNERSSHRVTVPIHTTSSRTSIQSSVYPSARTQQPEHKSSADLTKQDLTGFFGKPGHSNADIKVKWHGLVDQLDCFFKSRIASMRRKIDRLMPTGLKSDLEILSDVIATESTHAEKQLCKYINMNQERLVEELTAKVTLKDQELLKFESLLRQSTKDFDTMRHKYKKLKHHRATKVDENMKDLRDQMNRLEDENKNLGEKLRKSKVNSDDLIKQIGTNREKSLLRRIEEMSQQLEAANELRRRNEVTFDAFKADQTILKHELSGLAQSKEAQKEMKAKYKAKIESLKQTCLENTKAAIKDQELAMKNQHQDQIDQLIDKYAQSYLEIREHEVIVQRELDIKYDEHVRFISELKDDYEGQLERLRVAITGIEAKLEWVSTQSAKEIDARDHTIKDLARKRTLEEVEETRLLLQNVDELQQQIRDKESEVEQAEAALEEASQKEQRMASELSTIKAQVVELEHRQEQMEELTHALEAKTREAKLLDHKNVTITERLEKERTRNKNLVWALKSKVEEIKRVRNETDLCKKLLQGELAILKHELEQKCLFILDFAKRNERSNVKYYQEKDGLAGKLQKTQMQLESANAQNAKLLTEVADQKTNLREIGSEIEALRHQKLKNDRFESENAQLKVEVSSLQKLNSELQDQLKIRETELRAQYEEKLNKKLTKMQQHYDDELRHANSLIQQITHEREEFKHKAFTFQDAIFKLKDQRDMKRMKSREINMAKGRQTFQIEQIVTKSIAKVSKRSRLREDKSSLSRSTQHFKPGQSQQYFVPVPFNGVYSGFVDQRQSLGYQSLNHGMSTIGSGYYPIDLARSQEGQAFKNSKISTSQSKRRASNSPTYSGKHYRSMDLNSAQVPYQQPNAEQLTESKHGTARFHKANTNLNSSPLDRASLDVTDFNMYQNELQFDEHNQEPFKQVSYNQGSATYFPDRPRSPILTYKPQVKSQTSQSFQNTSQSYKSKEVAILNFNGSSRSDKENPLQSNSFERRLDQNQRQENSVPKQASSSDVTDAQNMFNINISAQSH